MQNALKTFSPKWRGELVLACWKCKKKLKMQPGLKALAKLKKSIKRRNKEHGNSRIHLVSVPCMDLCPKRGVTICRFQGNAAVLSILRNREDLDKLYVEGDTLTQEVGQGNVMITDAGV